MLIALASGLTAFRASQIPSDESGQYLNEPPRALEEIAIPVLSDLPVISRALFNQTLLVYLMYLSIRGRHLVLFKPAGAPARIRSSSASTPRPPFTVGIKVNRIRWRAVLFGSVFAGLGGATTPSAPRGPSTATSPRATASSRWPR